MLASRPEFITVVSGLPRSGTSLMMQMLEAGGVPILTDRVRSADESNRRGYLEYEPVKRLRSDNAWLPEARGHAVKIIHVLLPYVPLGDTLRYRVVLMQRPIDEVLASQEAMLRRDGKTGADPVVLKKAFASQLAQLDAWLGTRPDITVIRESYPAAVRTPAAVAARVSGFLELALDETAMAHAVDPALHRERAA